MEEFVSYLLVFIVVYFVYLFFIVGRKKLDKYQKSVEVRYLINAYKINVKEINIRKLAKVLGLTNAFIITLTLYIVSFFENDLLKFSLGFLILIALELCIYHLIGKYIKKRGI